MKRGRPPRENGGARCALHARCTVAEHALAVERAAAAGVSLTEYLLARVLGRRVKRRRPDR